MIIQKKRRITLLLVLIVSSFTLFCQESSEVRGSKIHVLFIGNSLTNTNNLPALVKKSAKLKGIKVKTKMVAFPNYAIEDHWNDGDVQKLIESGKHDYVIIQQGPSSQQDGRKMLIEYGKEYSKLCKASNSKLCFFMVWPSLSYYQTFDGVIRNHKEAASMNNAILLPVGKVWKEYIERTNNKEYYAADGFHPTLKGSQVAAEVIVDHLFGK